MSESTGARGPSCDLTLDELLTGNVTVLGLGVAGFGAAAGLLGCPGFNGSVTVVDEGDAQPQQQRAEILHELGATVLLGHNGPLPTGTEVLMASPGVPLAHPLVTQAERSGTPVWSELELAWRLRPATASAGAPWLVVSGTNGKTTATLMLHSMLSAAGLRSIAVGNIGTSIVDAIVDPEGFDVFAVEVSAQQMPHTHTISPLASVVLNFAPDHLDYFDSIEHYRRCKGSVYRNTQVAAFWNAADPATRTMIEQADLIEGCWDYGITLASPGPSMLGLVEDVLVDRVFLDENGDAQELGTLADVRPLAPHNVFNALAAAGLARAAGVPPPAVTRGLRAFTPAGHRIALVAEHGGVRWVDDSKATNAHAAAASLGSFESIVWVAGGLAKGQDFNDLVASHTARVRAAVVFGADREALLRALAAQAPHLPVVEVAGTEAAEVMAQVVHEAGAVAQPGDTVLLAPACASWDMFDGYARRGAAFADAVSQWMGARP
ncbi:MAG: UDP-N-acetylmuramoyl-L-alanine--D-glutamate ligase [Actinomycetales bacterium]|nr:UDP-N-acetylmuramoyl-L-alanine--D-glutamate ligase [Actinomycetales bacterium]